MGRELFYKALRFSKEFKALLRIPLRFFRLKSIVEKPSYYPELPRKSKAERWIDNICWLFHDRLQNNYYTSYGLDVKGFRDKRDYLPQHRFINTRNAGNQKLKLTISGDYNYIVLLRDKYVFSAYLASVIGPQYVIESVGIADRGRLFLKKENRWTEASALAEMPGQWVFKVIDGECGKGIYLVTIADGSFGVGGETLTMEEFSGKILRNARWLIQPVVKQHHALEAFGTRSVNTIRAVTIRGKSGKISVFNAFLRLGADRESFVDNRAMGGLGVGIELESGKLMKYGFQHDHFGGKTEVHPLSGIEFEGYQLPYWQETLALIENAHRQFYEMQSIGWDVVITENGPVLLEGNDDWEIGGPQDTYGGLKQRWLEQVNA